MLRRCGGSITRTCRVSANSGFADFASGGHIGLISITRAVTVSVAFEAGFLGLAFSRVHKNACMKTSQHSLFGPKPRNLAGSLMLSWLWQPVALLDREQGLLPSCSCGLITQRTDYPPLVLSVPVQFLLLNISSGGLSLHPKLRKE